MKPESLESNIFYQFKLADAPIESPIELGLADLQKYFEIEDQISQFITKLGKKLPKADPRVQSEDGKNIDIFWGRKFAIIVDEDSAAVGSFMSEEKEFKYFGLTEEAINYIAENVQAANNFQDI